MGETTTSGGPAGSGDVRARGTAGVGMDAAAGRSFPGPRSHELYYVYADADEAYLRGLEQHLHLLERQQLVRGWHRRKVLPGEDLQAAMDRRLERADIILLLVSPDLLDARGACSAEVERAMRRLREGEKVAVVPVIVRPCMWYLFFERFAPLPSDSTAISVRSERDTAFLQVAERIHELVVRERGAGEPDERRAAAAALAPGSASAAPRGAGVRASPWVSHMAVFLLGVVAASELEPATPVLVKKAEPLGPAQERPLRPMAPEEQVAGEEAQEPPRDGDEAPRRLDEGPRRRLAALPAGPEVEAPEGPMLAVEAPPEVEAPRPEARSAARAVSRRLTFTEFSPELARAEQRARDGCNELVGVETDVAVDLRLQPTGEVSVVMVAGPRSAEARQCVSRAFALLSLEPFAGSVFPIKEHFTLSGKARSR